MRRKISDPDFLEILYNYDIILLQETWLNKNVFVNLDIQGYIGVHLHGNKSRNTTKGRYSGGLSLYYKHTLKDKIKPKWYYVDKIM